MANYVVSDTSLTSIADAIRTAGSTSSSLEFPTGFVTAIGNISGGGGGGGSALDNLLELVDTVTIANNTTEVVINTPTSNGCFILIMSPLVNSQDGTSAGTYVFKAAEFAISGTNRNITNGTTYLFNSSGNSDYWGVMATYVDSSTKAEIKIKGNTNGTVTFLANHDLMIYRVKGD